MLTETNQVYPNLWGAGEENEHPTLGWAQKTQNIDHRNK